MQHRTSLMNKAKKEVGIKGLGRRASGNIWKGVGFPRDPHNIGGLGTCMLLMNYLTQTNLMKTVSKL